MRWWVRNAVVIGSMGCSLPFVLPMTAMAQIGVDHRCRLSSGTETATFDSATTSTGSITGGPLIAGTTAFAVTGSDSSGGYTGILRVTTTSGTLVTSDHGLLRTNGSFVEVGKADGAASTGIYAGAQGGLVLAGTQSSPGTFSSQVDAVLCLS